MRKKGEITRCNRLPVVDHIAGLKIDHLEMCFLLESVEISSEWRPSLLNYMGETKQDAIPPENIPGSNPTMRKFFTTTL